MSVRDKVSGNKEREKGIESRMEGKMLNRGGRKKEGEWEERGERSRGGGSQWKQEKGRRNGKYETIT